MSGATTVTVAGAGVLGLATAIALADAGCRVRLHDPGGPNASKVAAGMIAPAFEAVLDPASRPHLDLLLAARDMWPALAQRAGIGLDRSGAMAVGREAWLAQVGAGFDAIGLRAAEIGGATARALAPGLGDKGGHALLTREDWRVDAAAGLETLWRAAAEVGIAPCDGRLTGRGGGDVLVIATGADQTLMALAPELARLSPIKGHIVRLDAPARGVVVRGEGVYAVPGEALLFGATMEPGQADPQVDPEAAEPLLSRGMALFPGLTQVSYTIQAGIRAATPDGLPLVGPGATPDVLVAAGARRNGWLLAPLVAQMITAYVTGRDPGRFAARLDPARFGG